MTVIRVDGVKNTVKTLGYIDPELRKEFTKNVKEILKPTVDAAKAKYAQFSFPSGTARVWQQNRREIFPLEAGYAARRVTTKVSTNRRQTSTISVVQTDPAASVFEFASNGSLGAAFNAKNGSRPRVMWPAADATREAVNAQLVRYVDEVTERLNKELAL